MYEWILIIQMSYSSQQIAMKSEVACKAAQTQLLIGDVHSMCLNKKSGVVSTTWDSK